MIPPLSSVSSRRLAPIVVALGLALIVAGCGDTTAPTADEATDADVATEDPADAATSPAGEQAATDDRATEGAEGADLRVAAVFSGSTTDADYNTLGLLALQAAESELGAEITFSESVPVPDVERVMREYVDQGNNVIWTHGSQFVQQTADIAREFPDVSFIAESDAELEDSPPNLWIIDRRFHVGFYGIGALAAMTTQTGNVGYLGGLSLPFSYAEVHAMEQAIADLGLDAQVIPVWTDDFNDPAAARQLASQILAQDVDFLVGSLNLGMVGAFEAVEQQPAGETWITAKYTDKSQFAPDHYVTSLLYDFAGPLVDVVSSIQAGETSGYYPLGFDTGVALQTPLQNVDESVAADVQQVIDDLVSGATEVELDITPIE